MPISERAAAAALVAAALLLSACAEAPGVAGRGAPGDRAIRAVRVAQNDVIIAGPSGYCVDPATAQDTKSGAFVLLGSCAALGGTGRDTGRHAVLAASVSLRWFPGTTPGAAQLETFFGSAAGRASLAQGSRAGAVDLLEMRREGGVLYLKVRDGSAARPEGLGDVVWRAVFPVGDRVVSLTATSHRDVPQSDSDLHRTLTRFVAAVTAANRVQRPPEAA
ncbi:MAG: hypothetical protein KDA73_02495 [Rhodobacteraceae bacterium]|nr:hypothetical protein [Paracoccaceae bacterium]